MTTGQNELRMMWLITLVMVGLSAWYLDYAIVSYICSLGFVVSVMQYINALQQPIDALSSTQHVVIQANSKVPLYISSLVAILGGFIDLKWLMGLGITTWIFFLLRWLQRLELSLQRVQQHIHSTQIPIYSEITSELKKSETDVDQVLETTPNTEKSLADYLQIWIFQGNPVLKVAIAVLVIGVILLLRFATEHWQLTLALKLGIVACVASIITLLGFKLIGQNRSFGLALEGFGLGVLFLILFFAYYNLVIPSLVIATMMFIFIMAMTLYLSFKQNSFELSVMALVVAYFAPFTLPVRDATAVELIAYYVLINIGVACLTSVKAWKILNQIAFLITAIVGGIYALIHGYTAEKSQISVLVWAHAAIFIWLGFRSSQLSIQSDTADRPRKNLLDLALIFATPLTAYGFLYLIHFNERIWQATFSLIFAVIFALCWQWTRRSQRLNMLAQSYLSLMLIFIAFIPPILLEGEWSVIGWAVEGLLIYVWALEKHLKVAHYLAMALLVMASMSGLYYLVEVNPTPREIYWTLSVCYLTVVVISQIKVKYQTQLNTVTVSFLSLLSFSASLMLFALLEDEFVSNDAHIYSLAGVVLLFALLNEIVIRQNRDWTWLIPKWSALSPLLLIAIILAIEYSQNAVMLWDSYTARWVFCLSGVILMVQWLRPLVSLNVSKEWVSVGVLASLTCASLTFIPSMPYVSMVILPLALCLWSYQQSADSHWSMLWQTHSTRLLMAAWLVCSQLLSQQSFNYYWLPILNPFDVVSLAMLAGFIWMLLQQMKAGQDRGMVAVQMVLSLLWLSSYIVLRALHMYFDTPFNSLAVWHDARVQLSLTVLWVLLAFVTMWIATIKQLKPMWILGGSILVIVTLKLVLFDLSHIGTLTRVISFLLAGGVMLLIAYIAPMPDKIEKE